MHEALWLGGDMRPPSTTPATPLHGKFFTWTDLHINRGQDYVGLIKTPCLLVLSWIFTDFWLRAGDLGLRRCSAGGPRAVNEIRNWSATSCSASHCVFFFNLCLPNEFSHFHMTVVKQYAPLDTNYYVLFKLVDFYLACTWCNFIRPTSGEKKEKETSFD